MEANVKKSEESVDVKVEASDANCVETTVETSEVKRVEKNTEASEAKSVEASVTDCAKLKSIQIKDIPLNLQQCKSCCSYYHCPFCLATVFKPTRLDKLKKHIQSHFNKAVVHGGYAIHRCGLGCRPTLHYHCPYCGSTFLRKVEFERHVKFCKHAIRTIPACSPSPASAVPTSAKETPPTAIAVVSTTTTQSSTTASAVVSTTTAQSSTTASAVVSTTTAQSSTTASAVPTTRSFPSDRCRVLPAIKQRCGVCNILINKKNLKKHFERRHGKKIIQDINATSHHKSQCIDLNNGIYAVLKVIQGHSVPLHIQMKTWGENHKIICESRACQTDMEVARLSGLLFYQCKHIRSVAYCTSSADQVSLKEDVLTEMVDSKRFTSERKRSCLALQQLANSNHVPLSVRTLIGTSETKVFVSVFEPDVSYYSQLGRVMVVYNTKLNTWHCPCSKSKRPCVHKYVAKWHINQTQPELFHTDFTKDSIQEAPPAENFTEGTPIYPTHGVGLKNMVSYIFHQKKIPADLAEDLRVPSPEKDYPKNLCPVESCCQSCPGDVPLSEPILVTKKAKIITNWSIIENVSTYCKQCLPCGMFYRYQEWTGRLHNFNDHIILDIPLCLTLRSLLQVHTSVSRAVEFLQDLTGLKFPPADLMLNAYLHFEALTEHDYSYSCVKCGDYPPVVIMDLHKKAGFHSSVSDLEKPPEDFDGEVNVETFWDTLSKDMICRGFVARGAQSPFEIKPTFHFWAPWIGKNTRRSDCVLNTEYQKLHPSKPGSEAAETSVTDQRLKDELQKQNVKVIRELCKQCGLDTTGSRHDLLLRLSHEMSSRQTYDKVCEKIRGASGGFGVVMCPCGIIYSVKCILGAESPRDFVDLLFSWKHLPNIIIYDFAGGLATHANLRAPDTAPIHPHEGRLAEPSEENIRLAQSGKFKVSLPWLKVKNRASDPDGHPQTGSSAHYVLSDRFHEGNTEDRRDVLRKIHIVPQLAGKINSQATKQLLSKMRKNNYFLNMSRPSTHLFQMRTILHTYNVNKNKKVTNGLMDNGTRLLDPSC